MKKVKKAVFGYGRQSNVIGLIPAARASAFAEDRLERELP